MLITKRNFDAFLSAISKAPPRVGLDTETFGLFWWKSPHVVWYNPGVFSVQFSTEDGQDFYLDFLHSEDRLGDREWMILGREVFNDPRYYWFIHNGKFELHQLKNHGIDIAGTIHCTKHIARVCYNLEESLKLDDLGAKYLGTEKLDVKTYINENKLFTPVKKWGSNDKVEEWLHFNKLPLAMLVDYGVKDTQLCRDLGLWQLKEIERLNAEYYKGAKVNLNAVLHNENKLTKTVYKMERHGVKIDRAYCERAYAHEVAEYEALKKELDSHAKTPVDWLSADQIKVFFEARGERTYKVTKKGNMSFDKEALEGMNNPIAALILKYRYHNKRAHTYFENFIWLADDKDLIHCDIQNSGTEPGRQSCWNPNLQNVPKRRDKDEHDFKVRRCFIPRTEEGFFFADNDYKAAEYYLMLDYAREMSLIEKIKAGLDVHDATKEELSIDTRDEAKSTNFGLLYGMKEKSLARKLKCKVFEARQKITNYFTKLPKIAAFLSNVKDAACTRGYIFNWLGRLLFYVKGGWPNGTSYKAPNGLIQGGVGDALKVAMNNADERVFNGTKSRMLLPIHDAILCEIHRDEKHLIPLLQTEMRNAYPHKVLQLDVDAGYSDISWADLQDELPTG